MVSRLMAAGIAAARRATPDHGLAEDAAAHAVELLLQCRDSLDGGEAVYVAWVRTTARRHASRAAAGQDRNVPVGRAGSVPPKPHDDIDEKAIGRVLGVVFKDQAPSLGSVVAARVDFEERWKMLKPEARRLLELKYVEGHRSRHIAEMLGRSEDAVNMALTRAKAAARPLIEDLLDID